MAVPLWFKRILNHYEVPFETHHHQPAYSTSHLARAEHVSGHRVAKPVFLSRCGKPVTVVLPASAHLDLPRVKEVLGEEDLHFAGESEIAGWFKGCQPGSVPPVRLRDDQRILMDRALAHLGTIVMPAGTPEETVAVRFRDWYRMVRPGVGRFTMAHNGRSNGKHPPRILVVEDETSTNELFCHLLQREGYDCYPAEQGGRALVMASELLPSAILLDLMLPDMTGFDMVERLRQCGPMKSPPVIVVTAFDNEASRQRGRELGADAYLIKPFHPERLIEELRGALADAAC